LRPYSVQVQAVGALFDVLYESAVRCVVCLIRHDCCALGFAVADVWFPSVC